MYWFIVFDFISDAEAWIFCPAGKDGRRRMGGKIVTIPTIQLRLIEGLGRIVLFDDLRPRGRSYLRSVSMITFGFTIPDADHNEAEPARAEQAP